MPPCAQAAHGEEALRAYSFGLAELADDQLGERGVQLAAARAHGDAAGEEMRRRLVNELKAVLMN